MAGDWEYEEMDEAEPYEAADPWESDESDEAEDFEAEADGDGEAVYWGRPPQRRPAPPTLRGVQTAVVRTPAGNASIQLPSKVPTLAELTRVQRELAQTQRRVRTMSTDLSRARRAARARARADTRGARNGIFLVALESVRDVLRDVGTYSLVRAATGK